MVGEITIRGGEMSDADELIALLRVLFTLEEDFSFNEAVQRRGIELLLSRQGAERQVFVAEKDGRVAACVPSRPSFQRLKGSGGAGGGCCRQGGVSWKRHRQCPHDAVDGWAREKRLKRLQLLAEKDNTQALKFYRSRGWEITNLICVRSWNEWNEGRAKPTS